MVFAILLQAGPAEQVGAMNSQLFEYIRALFVFGGILLLAYVAVRHWAPKLAEARGPASGAIQVMARATLDGRKTLYVVKTGADFFLIGASETDLHYLATLDASTMQSAIDSAPAPGANSPFSLLLRAARKS